MLRNTIILSLAAAATASTLRDRSHYESKFFSWMSEHNVFPKDGSHFVKMLENFISNDLNIEQVNSQNLSYTLGHNQFSHMSRTEWNEKLNAGINKPSLREIPDAEHVESGASSYVDWVSQGKVTSVKNQGSCGSCWAFSTAAALESYNIITHGTNTNLSPQELVDCDSQDSGCNGGWFTSSFTWVKNNKGLTSESSYPYKGVQGSCKKSSVSNVSGTGISGYVSVGTGKSKFVDALNKQPLAIAIDASDDLMNYKSGVYTGACSSTSVNHGVTAVGYGKDNASGLEYIKIKNSWGTSWGESGYIRIVADSTTKGHCSVYSSPFYPK